MKSQESVFFPHLQARRSLAMSAKEPELRRLSEKEECVLRHDRIRMMIILGALICMFLSAVLFFTLQIILPMLIVSLLAVVVYKYIDNKLRAIERRFL